MKKGRFNSVAEKRAYLRARKREKMLEKQLLGEERANASAYAEGRKPLLVHSASSGGRCSPK
jgi:hypothetical protein